VLGVVGQQLQARQDFRKFGNKFGVAKTGKNGLNARATNARNAEECVKTFFYHPHDDGCCTHRSVCCAAVQGFRLLEEEGGFSTSVLYKNIQKTGSKVNRRGKRQKTKGHVVDGRP
jgi:hypothetical protein